MSVKAARARPFRFQMQFGQLFIYVFLIAGAVIALFPFVWMVLTSLKTQTEVARGAFWPEQFRWYNYLEAWSEAEWGPYFDHSGRWIPGYFLNTLFIAFCTVTGNLITNVLAAYAFARIRFPGKNVIFFAFLATMMIPGEVTIIPNFLLVSRLGWVNNYLGLIVPWTASVFYIFLLRQFFMGIPDELHDAALMDGCGHLRFLIQIVLPLSKAAMVTVILLSFISSWNAFLWPLIVARDVALYPIQVGLRSFITEMGNEVQLMMAAATFVIAPILVLYFFAQKQFTEGIATTGLKG
ncbi:MAG: carbohydrate ABC transporter permease [Chloroflexi bacterium]|nr:carbohydrate ABC transporter permease [Chloroflexota bacterium]